MQAGPHPIWLEMRVPEILQNKTYVHKSIVTRNDHLPARLMREQRTQQVCQITQQPFCKEEYRQSCCRLYFVVLIYLWHLRKQP